MRHLFLITSCFLIWQNIAGQVLNGTIKDPDGEPIPYATVFIQELKQGATANTRGDYEIRLPAGKYSVIFQSLGFEPEFRDITVKSAVITVNVTLQVQYYEIPEVRISASGEDPAYGIMRKAIGMAPYYLNHVSYYKADLYLKGDLLVNRIPKILQRSMRVEARNSSTGQSASTTTLKEGSSYMMESFNEITFNAPDRYVQKVISTRSTFPDEGNEISPMDYIQASFYEPILNDMFISPLSPDAFFHYRFSYKGISAQGKYVIDKIEVKPKRKSQQLFEGTIYIIEDLWCLHSVDLVNDNIAGRIRVQQMYIEVQEDVWMPVSHKFDINISIIGVKAAAGYGSSIKYNEVQVNNNLRKPSVITADFSGNLMRPKTLTDTATLTKTGEQIEKILKKEELSNRDMARLSDLMRKQSEESFPDSVRRISGERERTTFVIEKDANKKDSTYWAAIRPIPLSANEKRSLRISDSIKSQLNLRELKSDTLPAGKTKQKNSFIRNTKYVLSGHTWSDTLGFSFNNGGLLRLSNLSFNTVDGFVYGAEFRVNKTWNKNSSLSLYPDFRYAFSRQRLMWVINGQFRFSKIDNGQVFFRTGIVSRDFNNAGGVNTLVNSVSSVFMKKNYLKLYESRYATIGFRKLIGNGIGIVVSGGFEDRKILDNSSNFSLIKTTREYSLNVPVNPYLIGNVDPYHALQNHYQVNMSAQLTWTRRSEVNYRANKFLTGGGFWPTFSLFWKHGINNFSDMGNQVRQFDLIRFELNKRADIGAMSEFRWRYRAGGFLNNEGLTFIDFNHFNSQPLFLLLNDYEDAFKLPYFYSLSTPEMFSEFHFKYTTPYLLLKLLPGLSKTLMRENLSASFLWSKYREAYTEIGYSISEFLLLGEIGIYIGFDNFNFRSAGGKIVLKFN